MAINVYRVYNVDNVFPEDAAHLFSIVTTENSAAYAIPQNPKITDFEGFDDKRVEFFLSLEKLHFCETRDRIFETGSMRQELLDRIHETGYLCQETGDLRQET